MGRIRTGLAVLGLLLAASVTGCATSEGNDQTEQSGTVTNGATMVDRERALLLLVHTQPDTFPLLNQVSDALIVRDAEIICSGFDDGYTLVEVVQGTSTGTGMSISEAARFTGAAVNAKCSEYRYMLAG